MKPWIIAAALALPVFSAADNSFLLRNVMVHPVTGPEIANGAVLVVDGRIAGIGAKIAAPKSVRIIDGKGLHVYPGMIDSATELGISEIGSVRETNDTGELGTFNPQLRAEIAVNAASEHIPVTRSNGITSFITLPASATARTGRLTSTTPPAIITGQAPLMHMDGWTWEEMDIRRTAAIQMLFPSLPSGGRSGGGFGEGGLSESAQLPFAEAKREYERRTREVEDFFEKTRRYQVAKTGHDPAFKMDLKYEAMLPVLEGKVPLFVTANRERGIRDAIQFADRQKIRIVLANPREFGNTLTDVASRKIPVITGPTLALPDEEDDPYDAAFSLPAEMYKAGIKFAFGSYGNQFSRNLPYQAATAVAYGLPYEEALKSVTLNAAEIWGVADQMGSIDKGKWADLMVTDGDPLETKTQVKMLFIKGKQVELTNRHTLLYEKYMSRP